jgi:hypothetical protein
VNSFTGKLFRIDLNDDGGAIDAIDAIEGVTLKGGDGMILDRGKLVVVTGNPAQLNFVKLEDGASRAELRGTQTSDKLHGPSTGHAGEEPLPRRQCRLRAQREPAVHRGGAAARAP